ncbi:MAG: hypothetical protein P8Y91_12135, partial [Desulfuromonadales bacterium]
MAEWMSYEVLGIPIDRYAIAFAIILSAFVIKKIFAFFFRRNLLAWARSSKSAWDDRFLACLEKPAEFLIFLIGLWFALKTQGLP